MPITSLSATLAEWWVEGFRPVQAYLPLAVGQGGGVWDDVDSRSDPGTVPESVAISARDALEEQNID